MSDTRTLDEILDELDDAYGKWKGGEKSKNKLKEEFFEMAISALKEETKAERVAQVKAKDEFEARALFAKQYPTWDLTVVRENPDKDGYYEAILTENPFYKEFSIEHNGKVFRRQVVSGSNLLDDERLKEEDRDLWEDVTEWPQEGFLRDILAQTSVDLGDLYDVIDGIAEKHGVERVLKDLDSLDPYTLAALQKYMYEGPPTIKFPAPSVVKD